ncbi:MAG: YkgJ family cysteine cluster protein [Desulfobacterales bacterium]|nr:YkgJ family cysteine cluster protein [Desulfobacterales bacterium]MCP4162649.1 YkgJ family cysteine cluster protein [Deltaproteobacteria bacterium]
MSEDMIPVGANESFQFNCSKENKCFNECCRDLNQFLTPYDILRLRKNLNISTEEFINKYTTTHMGDESGLPVLTFKVVDNELKCPFVSDEGCTVYGDRPASCRTYPLARAISRNRDTGKITEYFALIKEPHCLGFSCEKKQTPNEWNSDQEIIKYNEMNDLLMELISLKNTTIPGSLDSVSMDIFILGCYNLDRFRDNVVNDDFLAKHNIPADVVDKIKVDDELLLKTGINWVKYELFGMDLNF